jgi:two-component system sensor histidine kinase HydH
MPQESRGILTGVSRGRLALIMAAFLAVLLFVFTYIGIKSSRSDSLELLKQQGAALIESIVLSADNAIKANSFFDLLVQEKFSDLAGFLETRENLDFSGPELADFASGYGVDAILIFDSSMSLKASGARGIFVDLNRTYSLLIPEIDSLFKDTSANSSFQIVEGDLPGEISVYYLSKTSDDKFITAIVSDALFYRQAKENIGIGYLVQNIAREVGVEYILFQTPDGIIFSSRKIGPIPKIEADVFLKKALDSDSTCVREYVFNDRRILELVKKFSSIEYGEGLFRLGVSLDKYHAIISGFDRQMIVLSLVLFFVLVLAVLYLIGKEKRLYLDRSFRRIKSLSEKVFDSINAGLIAIRSDGLIEMVNDQILNIFEISEGSPVGKSWRDYSFKDHIPFDSILAGRSEVREVESVYGVSGNTKHLLINTGRLVDAENNVTGAVAVVYDYTRIKELEEAARRKERLSELGDLAAGVAHEIRNPLNAISIAAQRLLGEFEPKENTEEFRAFAGQIRMEAARLNEIVTRFLSLAKGKSSASARINVSRVVAEATDLLNLGLADGNIVLNSKIDPDITTLVSEDRLKQLVINLVKNGIEACRDGGTVTVALSMQNEEIILSVGDTGKGIPREIQKKIFSPYFTTKEKGTGLGLSIVHQIVEELEGRIELRTPEGGGTLIEIRFPRR